MVRVYQVVASLGDVQVDVHQLLRVQELINCLIFLTNE